MFLSDLFFCFWAFLFAYTTTTLFNLFQVFCKLKHYWNTIDSPILDSNLFQFWMTNFLNPSSTGHVWSSLKDPGGFWFSFSICNNIGKWYETLPFPTHDFNLFGFSKIISTKLLCNYFDTHFLPLLKFLQAWTNSGGSCIAPPPWFPLFSLSNSNHLL